MSVAQIRSALKRGGRQRNLDKRSTEIQTALRSQQLAAAAVLTAAFAATTTAAVAIITEFNRQITELETTLTTILSSTRTPTSTSPCQDSVSSSAPGRSASSGTTRTAMPTPSLARTTPARHHSRSLRAANEPSSPATSATADSTTPSTNGRSVPCSTSPGCRTFYDQHRDAGDLHHQALRALGNRLVGILHGCLRTHTTYDEDTAWAHHTNTADDTAA